MTTFDAFRFDGKRALVVGGATGMGAAAAELLQSAGADVVVMDYAEITLPGATAIHVNLAEKDSIDAALDQFDGPVHALLSCAGVADGTPGIEKINFIGHRHIIDRLLADDLPAPGLGHRLHLLGRRARLGVQPPPDQGVPGHPRLRQRGGLDRGQRGRRLHVVQAGHLRLRRHPGHAPAEAGHPDQRHLPRPHRHPAGPGQQGACGWPSAPTTAARWASRPATPLEQAYPLVFLCSAAASAINGITMVTDSGYIRAGVTGRLPGRHRRGHFLLGRLS